MMGLIRGQTYVLQKQTKAYDIFHSLCIINVCVYACIQLCVCMVGVGCGMFEVVKYCRMNVWNLVFK